MNSISKINFLSPLSTSNKLKKTDQLFIRREKSKSNIQLMMDQIYQEEEKNSKIVKYLTHSNDFRASPSNRIPKTPHIKMKSLTSSIKTAQSPMAVPRISTKGSIMTTNSIDICQESPKIRIKKVDLEIEDPNIISIYQNSLGRPLKSQKSSLIESMFLTNTNFDDDLKRRKLELNKYLIANTDVIAKIKQKQKDNEKFNLFNAGEKKKKHLNVKEDSIKKRFMKVVNKNNLEKYEKLNFELINKLENLENSRSDEPRKSSLIKRFQTYENPKLKQHSQKKRGDIKSILRELIIENVEKPVKKLTTIDKIREKYEYSSTHRKKLEMDLLEGIQNSPMILKKSTIAKIEIPKNEIIQKENAKESVLSNYSMLKSPQQKFDVFFNDLMDYYQGEMKDKGDVEKEISHQVKVYDEELKKINEKLFEFNANLDKDFNKDLVEGGLAKFSSIRRVKRRR